MSEEDADSKVHEATPRKIEEARRKGETPASQEVVSSAVFMALVISIGMFGSGAVSRGGGTLASFLGAPERYFGGDHVIGMVVADALATAAASLLGPFLVLALVVAVLGYVVQGTVTFAPEKIRPKLNRISPINGAKQKFGREGMFNFAKSFGKLVIYSTLLAIILWLGADVLIHSSHLPAEAVLSEAIRLVAMFLLAACVTMAAFGLTDLFWQRQNFFRRQRMTQNEMKDEMKESEGDPYQKSARRQRARELAATGRIMDTAGADVVIVNPTHYAVALRWDRGKRTAPVCVAKGTDLVAARIRDIANENGVPIRSDPPTARVLYATTAVGEEISPEHFRAVAAAIRFADAIRPRAR